MSWWITRKEQLASITNLRDEVRKRSQEREAARRGLLLTVEKLAREIEKLPLDVALESVGKDIAGGNKNG